MRHEFHIHPVIASDVVDAIGELLPGGEQLLVVAEAAGERVSARIDDLGVGQDQMNEPEMPTVFGILSMKKGLPLRYTFVSLRYRSPRRVKSSAASSASRPG